VKSSTPPSSQEKHRTLDTPGTSDDESSGSKVEKRKVSSSALQKGKQPVASAEVKKPSQQTMATWRRGDDDLEPSAKMLALVEQLQIAESAGDKTIVFSQCMPFLPSPFISFSHQMWQNDDGAGTGTSMLDLLETVLVRYGIQNLRYDGKMRSEARDATLVAFRKMGGPRVILISTKCGGVGLNLTAANRVIKCVPNPHLLLLSSKPPNHIIVWNFHGILRPSPRRTIVSIVSDKKRMYS